MLYQTFFRPKLLTIKNNMSKQNKDVPAKRCELGHFEKAFVEGTGNLLDCGKAIGRPVNNNFVKLCKSSVEKVLAKKKTENVNNVFEAGCAILKTYYFYLFKIFINIFHKNIIELTDNCIADMYCYSQSKIKE